MKKKKSRFIIWPKISGHNKPLKLIKGTRIVTKCIPMLVMPTRHIGCFLQSIFPFLQFLVVLNVFFMFS